MSQTDAAASSITGSQMQSFLSTQFSDLFSDSNWQTNWSSASSQTITTGVSPSQTATTSVSANDSSVRQLTQAYTMLSEFSGQNLSSGARDAVNAAAAKLMDTGIAGITNVASGVGISQKTLDTANTNIGTQVSVLQSNINDLVGVDTTTLATKVSALQTQLTASFELTNKISQLSLVNYLTS